VNDNLPILEVMAAFWSHHDGSEPSIRAIVDGILQQTDWWGKDLRSVPGLSVEVARSIQSILLHGMRHAIALATANEAAQDESSALPLIV
jgi:mannitol-1-phosphate/altronate dehydrogenase